MKTTALRTLALTGLVSALAAAAAAEDATPLPQNKQIVSAIEYDLFTGPEIYDAEGRKLVWVGNISGEITGTMKWWFVQPSPVPPQLIETGVVLYYSARWEIWADDGTLVLAGESAGKTVVTGALDGIWDGHGVVTEAAGAYNTMKGRHIYETGPVLFLDGEPPSGKGLFLIH